MENSEKQSNTIMLRNVVKDGKMHMKVAGCTMTLKFPNKAQDSVITEVKRMILVGHTRKEIPK